MFHVLGIREKAKNTSQWLPRSSKVCINFVIINSIHLSISISMSSSMSISLSISISPCFPPTSFCLVLLLPFLSPLLISLLLLASSSTFLPILTSLLLLPFCSPIISHQVCAVRQMLILLCTLQSPQQQRKILNNLNSVNWTVSTNFFDFPLFDWVLNFRFYFQLF